MNCFLRSCRLSAFSALALLGLVLGGCGGGVGSGGTGGDATTTSYTSGPITGFGSIIVNAVRFDESKAQVEDGDGNSRSTAELKLGMTVDIDASVVVTGSSGATSTASRVLLDSELLGPIAAIDVPGASFSVLGQRVTTDATTAFDPALGSLASLGVGTRVEVWGVYDAAAARFRATRVGPAAAAAGLHLRGPIAQLDSAARSLRIGATSYAFDGAAGVPADLAVGSFVRLSLNAVPGSATRWNVVAFGTALRTPPDSDTGSIKGLISSFTSSASFSVNGHPVDASAAVFPQGKSALALGVRVQAQGKLRSGVLKATQVDLQSDDEEEARGFELHGAIESVNAIDHSFVLRGQTVATTRSDLVYEGGSVADLAAGRNVEVKGVLSADGLRIDATSIAFD